jgi:hypothetical protein
MAECPTGLDATNNQVVSAAGLLIAAIFRECYSDPLAEVERFYQTLRTCVDDRARKAKLAELRPSLN